MVSSNLLIHKQLTNTREELVKARRRCAELSEVEARKKGLELRCLGLERVVEELMSAIDLLKMASPPQNKIAGEALQEAVASDVNALKGLAIHIEKCSPDSYVFGKIHAREVFAAFAVSTRRRFIPYRLRAIILYLIKYFRRNNLVDEIVGMGILIVGTMLLTSYIVIERGRAMLEKNAGKIGNVRAL